MIVTAALNWWNEPIEMLTAAVASVAAVADRIVALDGAYRRYPKATIASDPAQAEAIRSVALDNGIEPLVVKPNRLWAGQIEKRTELMRLASDGSDWTFILDADYVVTADRDRVRRQIESGGFDVYEVPLVTPEGDYATNWHRGQSAMPESWVPLVFRAFPGIRVEDHHWWYSAEKDGERVWLWGGSDRYRSLPHGTLADIRVTHTTNLRFGERVLDNRSWYNDVYRVSAKSGQEDDRDGLDDPIYDIHSMLI